MEKKIGIKLIMCIKKNYTLVANTLNRLFLKKPHQILKNMKTNNKERKNTLDDRKNSDNW
jgi:ABC-type enterochelin transport system ATPase subunit